MISDRAKQLARERAMRQLDLYLEEIEAYRKQWGVQQVDKETHLTSWWRATARLQEELSGGDNLLKYPADLGNHSKKPGSN